MFDKKLVEEFYKNDGMVIYVKGQPRIMIHPDNLESNLKALSNGAMLIDWSVMGLNIPEKSHARVSEEKIERLERLLKKSERRNEKHNQLLGILKELLSED